MVQPLNSAPEPSIFGGPDVSITGSKRKEDGEHRGGPEVKKLKGTEGNEVSNFENKQASESVVALLVGPQQIVIIAEMSTLVASAPFFQAALNHDFKEADTRSILLAEEHFRTINWFITWLYSGKKQLPGTSAHVKDLSCMNLYCFAEKVGCVLLKQQLITQFYNIIKDQHMPRSSVKLGNVLGYIAPSSIYVALSRLPEDSNLLGLILLYFNSCVTSERLEEVGIEIKEYPESFQAAAFRKHVARSQPVAKLPLPALEMFLG